MQRNAFLGNTDRAEWGKRGMTDCWVVVFYALPTAYVKIIREKMHYEASALSSYREQSAHLNIKFQFFPCQLALTGLKPQ